MKKHTLSALLLIVLLVFALLMKKSFRFSEAIVVATIFCGFIYYMFSRFIMSSAVGMLKNYSLVIQVFLIAGSILLLSGLSIRLFYEHEEFNFQQLAAQVMYIGAVFGGLIGFTGGLFDHLGELRREANT